MEATISEPEAKYGDSDVKDTFEWVSTPLRALLNLTQVRPPYIVRSHVRHEAPMPLGIKHRYFFFFPFLNPLTTHNQPPPLLREHPSGAAQRHAVQPVH